MNEIQIYQPIERGLAERISYSLQDFKGEPVNVRIDSDGGSAPEGINIFNMLRRYGKADCYVDGWACSAGSLVALGGRRTYMAQSSMLMIHCASLGFGGNASEMEKNIPILRKLDDQLAQIYANKSGKPKSYWLQAMGEETYYTAREAVAAWHMKRDWNPRGRSCRRFARHCRQIDAGKG